jgi:8-oxo-dGTP pyrophosphatase MutT (NUDIX family)
LDGGRGAAEAIRARWRQEQLAAGAGPSAVVTCFLQRDGRLCLLQRSQLVDGARGLWHVVAGYLPRGSAPLQHALIEIQEETGLSASQVGLVRSGEPVRIPDRWGGPGWLVHAFLFDLLEGEPSLNWEHVALAWVRPDQLTSYRCVPWLHHVYEQLRSD